MMSRVERLSRCRRSVGGYVLLAALLAAGCGSGPHPTAQRPSAIPSATDPSRGPVLGPATDSAPTASSSAQGAPGVAGVRYIVPPGWEATTPTAGEVDLKSETGLSIVLRAAPAGTPPDAGAAAGSGVTVDGASGRRAGMASAGGYAVVVDVVHGSMRYLIRCFGPDAENVNNVCDGFLLTIHWTG